MKKIFYIAFLIFIAFVLLIAVQKKIKPLPSISSTTSATPASAENNKPFLSYADRVKTPSEDKRLFGSTLSSSQPEPNQYSNVNLIHVSDSKNAIKWLDKSEAANISLERLRSKASNLTSSEAKKKPIRTKEDAVAHIEANLAMAKRPAAAYEDDNFFYFSGGTTAYAVKDFSTGLTVSKATGEIKGW